MYEDYDEEMERIIYAGFILFYLKIIIIITIYAFII